MKIGIVHRPNEKNRESSRRRFAQMTRAIQQAGMQAFYQPVHTTSDLQRLLSAQQPDLLYCANYYLYDQQARLVSIHKILADQNVPYIGSSPESLALVLTKAGLKTKWHQDGIATPAFFLACADGKWRNATHPDFPVILKPNREGNSRGLDQDSIVFDQQGLERKLKQLWKKYPVVMVEKYLAQAQGFHEFTIAMIGSGANRLLMPAEITLKQKKKVRIVTTLDKDNHQTQALPVTDASLRERIVSFAEAAFASANMRDYSRLDVLMANDRLYAIEINGLPMIPDLWFEVCASSQGLNPNQTILAIVLAGIQRAMRSGRGQLSVPEGIRQQLPPAVFDRLTG